MDSWSPTGAAFQRLGFDPTGVRRSSFGAGGDPTGVRSTDWNTRSGDPTGVGDYSYGSLGRLGQPRGFDPLLDFGVNAMQAQLDKRKADEAQFSFFQNQQPGSTGGQASLGGDWAGVDQWNSAISAAAAKWGVPANMIKAVMKLESNGDVNATGAPGVWGPMQVYGEVWGYGPWMSDPVANIDKGAQILKENLDSYGSWYEALRHYHGIGSDGYTTDAQYADIVMGNYNQLNNVSGGAIGGAANYGGSGSSSAANALIQKAVEYVGVSYVWGAIPGKGQDPRSTGWDCSGFTYWLDQNYGNGSLPMGSHYQYQHAVDTGQLFTNQQQLQPGDLIFFNTGSTAGGGGNLNGASHVGMYIGNDQFIHAANPDAGTIISSFSSYTGMYPYMGAMHMSWSGGGAAYSGMSGGASGYTSAPAATDWGSQMMNFLLTPGYHW